MAHMVGISWLCVLVKIPKTWMPVRSFQILGKQRYVSEMRVVITGPACSCFLLLALTE